MKDIKITEVSSTGCASCIKAREILEEDISKNFPNVEIEFVDIFSDKGKQLVQKHNIMFSPGIILNDKLFAVGDLDKDKLINEIETILQA